MQIESVIQLVWAMLSLKKISLDASLLYTQLEREATNQETQLSGTFKTIVFAPGIQFNYTF